MHDPRRLRPGALWSALGGASLAAALIIGYAFPAGPVALTWVAGSRGVVALSRSAGSVQLEIPLASGARAIAADAQTGTLWVVSGRDLRSFSFSGEPKASARLGAPIGDEAALAVDRQSGRVWLATRSEVQLFSAHGHLLERLRLPCPVVDIALDDRTSRLWVAGQGFLGVYNRDGGQAIQVDTQGVKKIRALDYDLSRGEIWFIADDIVRRYDADGGLVFAARHSWFDHVVFTAADHAGGLWAASRGDLAHVNGAGAIDVFLTPDSAWNPLVSGPAHGAAAPTQHDIVSLVADAEDHTAWIATREQVSHYGAGGVLLDDFAAGRADGDSHIRQLALAAPALAPEISFTAPTDESVLHAARPTFRVSYAGGSINLNSLALAVNGEPLDALCEARASSATCISAEPLADGDYDVTATIANLAGSRSDAAAVRVTVSTPLQ